MLLNNMNKLIYLYKTFIIDNFTIRQTKPKKRIEFIDLAKGFCIVLVVLLHSGYLTNVPVLKALRMPLYFILSGLFFKDYGNILNFTIKKTNRLLIPFVAFFILYLIVCVVLSFHLPSLQFILEQVVHPFIGPGILNGPIWFLICLFWVNILYYIVNRLSRHLWIKILSIVILGFIGLILHKENIYLPLFMSSAFSATPFFFFGVILRKLPILYKTHYDNYIFIGSIFVLIVTTLYCVLEGTPFIEFRTNEYNGNIIGIYLVSIFSVVTLLILCKAISWLPIISYVGRFSVIVLCCHAIFIDYAYLVLYIFLNRPISTLESLITSWILCWVTIPIFKSIFPYITAQKDLIKIPGIKNIKDSNLVRTDDVV